MTLSLKDLIEIRGALEIGYKHQQDLFQAQATPIFSDDWNLTCNSLNRVSFLIKDLSEAIPVPIQAEVPHA